MGVYNLEPRLCGGFECPSAGTVCISYILEALVEIQSLNIDGKAGDTKLLCFYLPQTTYTKQMKYV